MTEMLRERPAWEGERAATALDARATTTTAAADPPRERAWTPLARRRARGATATDAAPLWDDER